MQRPQRSEDERRGQRRAPAHQWARRGNTSPPAERQGPTKLHLHNSDRRCQAGTQRRAGSDAVLGYGGRQGYAVSSLAPGPSPSRQPERRPDDPTPTGLRSHKSAWGAPGTKIVVQPQPPTATMPTPHHPQTSGAEPRTSSTALDSSYSQLVQADQHIAGRDNLAARPDNGQRPHQTAAVVRGHSAHLQCPPATLPCEDRYPKSVPGQPRD